VPTQAKDIFYANTQSLREVLTDPGLGLYIPAYQRPYGWAKGQVAKLLDDVLHGLNTLPRDNENFTFLGTIITIHDTNYSTIQPVIRSQTPSKVLTVIDGQQRLSTLIALTVCIHGLIRSTHWTLYKGKEPTGSADPLSHLHDEAKQILPELGRTFYDAQTVGDVGVYPRLIRAFEDAWAKRAPDYQFESPLARLVFEYAIKTEKEGLSVKPGDLKPKPTTGKADGADLYKRFDEITKYLKALAVDKQGDGESDEEEREHIPSLALFAENVKSQRALMNHELPEPLAQYLKDGPSEAAAQLMRLIMFGWYVLNRVAMTVVQGKDEEYAFTIFESLNTTGEPLTAFETFAPKVVSLEGLKDYTTSPAREYMDEIKAYVEGQPAGTRRQAVTVDMLISFALAETGSKLSKRLPDQRAYLKTQFERHADDAQARYAFLQHLRNTSRVLGASWALEPSPFPHLPADSTTNTIRLCLSFLSSLNHTVAIAPIVRFYTAVLESDKASSSTASRDLEAALKAITAFTVLWRTSRRTTGNIDQQYRDLMAGGSSKALARSRDNLGPVGSEEMLSLLRSSLRDKLANAATDPVKGREPWIAFAKPLPIYKINSNLTRFLLLTANHDSVADDQHPGLIKPGKAESNPCLDYDSWLKEELLTVEHVAPQAPPVASTWLQSDLYQDTDHLDCLGNLVLCPQSTNSSLGARSWSDKRVLYAALGAKTHEEAGAILTQAEATTGLQLGDSTSELVAASKYMPHLQALGDVKGDWNLAFVETRAERLLGLAWDRLHPWLEDDD